MSTVSLPALMPYLLPPGKIAIADLMAHRWVQAELKRIRAAEAQPKAA